MFANNSNAQITFDATSPFSKPPQWAFRVPQCPSTTIRVLFIFRQCVCKPGGIIRDNPVAEKLLMTDLARWPPKELLVDFLDMLAEVPGEGGKVGHKFAVTGKLRNSSFFSGECSSDSFSDKLLSCLKNQYQKVHINKWYYYQREIHYTAKPEKSHNKFAHNITSCEIQE